MKCLVFGGLLVYYSNNTCLVVILEQFVCCNKFDSFCWGTRVLKEFEDEERESSQSVQSN